MLLWESWEFVALGVLVRAERMGKQGENWRKEWSDEKSASWQSGEAVEVGWLSRQDDHPFLRL
jgi:hypothetical protein